MENEIQRTSGAQAKANEETNEAARTAAGTRGEFAKEASERLDKIDAESRELHAKIAKNAKDFPADAQTRLSGVDRESKSIRSDLSKLGTGAPQAIQDVETTLDHRLDAVEKTIDDID